MIQKRLLCDQYSNVLAFKYSVQVSALDKTV